MGGWLDVMRQYGADVDGALERCVDDEELYLDCLRQFQNDPEFERLRIAIASGDGKAAFDSAHTIKGVAGNLGLTPLYDAVVKLVEPLRLGHTENMELLGENVLAEQARLAERLKTIE